MSGEFVADYVQDCIGRGIQQPADIRKEAESEIQNINAKIKEIETLRAKQSKLRAVVRHMGGGAKAKRESEKVMDFSIDWKDTREDFRALCLEILALVKKKGSLSPREIMDGLWDIKDNKTVYSAIKWLHNKNIISRKPEDRSIILGSTYKSFIREVNPTA